MPVEMTEDRWQATSSYLQEVFGREDEQLRTLMARAVAAGIPDIAVSAEVGRLLKLLAQLAAPDGAKLAIEVGTLAGYSAIWLARGLAVGGRLITIEIEPKHAAFAAAEFARAGVKDRIEQRMGPGLEVLPKLARELGPASVDLVFIDAVKTEYGGYVDAALPMLKVGGLLVVDNVLGAGSWWVTDANGSSGDRDAIDAFNHRVAGDARFESVALPVRQGVLIARRVRA
jgi:predicted O-methyltransferase YrrM